MKLFDFLSAMTVEKKNLDFSNEEIRKDYDQFMINRFVSMSEIFIHLANEINQYPDIPSETHYLYYLHTLPQRKQYFPYIKKQKDVSKHARECVMRYYQVGKKTCEDYINRLSPEQIDKIVSVYEHGKVKN